MTEYTYNNIYKKVNGGVSTYVNKITYIAKPKYLLPDNIIQDIKYKYNLGVTKKRLCAEYNLYHTKLEKILVF